MRSRMSSDDPTSPLGELEIIRQYFVPAAGARADVHLGIGDDAALTAVPAGSAVLAVVATTAGLPEEAPPGAGGARFAQRLLAPALARLAALGAEPAWVTLALTLPRADPEWLEGFGAAIRDLARAHGAALVGGDTTRGDLLGTVVAHGLVAGDGELARAGARPGDALYMSGTLGEDPDAAPRIAHGLALRGWASAANDLTRGLEAGLTAILDASGVGARVELARVPLPAGAPAPDGAAQWRALLSHAGGLELCFTVHPERVAQLAGRLGPLHPPCTRIGVVGEGLGLRWITPQGDALAPSRRRRDPS